jgi:hypothetical protein
VSQRGRHAATDFGLTNGNPRILGFLLVFAGLAVVVARSRAFDLASLLQGRGTGHPSVTAVDHRNLIPAKSL